MGSNNSIWWFLQLANVILINTEVDLKITGYSLSISLPFIKNGKGSVTQTGAMVCIEVRLDAWKGEAGLVSHCW